MRNSRRSSTDCAQQPPRRTGRPNRQQKTPSGRFRPAGPEHLRGVQGIQGIRTIRNIRNIRVRRHPRTATAERAKGEPSEGSPFCFGAENGTRTRAARERFRELWQTPPTPGRGALRSQVPSPSCTGIQNKKGRTFWILPSCFGAENGTRTRAARERFREFQQTPPTPGRGALRSQVPSPSCTGIQNKKGRTFWILPSCFGAENGFPTQAYSSFTISALHEAFSSKVTPAMRSSCTRLHPNAFDKDNGKLHLIQAKMGMVLFFECGG